MEEPYDEQLQLEKVTIEIKAIVNDVIDVISNLSDAEIVSLVRETEKEYNELGIDPYEGDEAAELEDAPLFKEGIIAFLTGEVEYMDYDNAKVVRYLSKNGKIKISDQLSKNIDLLLDS
jgi:hypothetical protein